MGSAGAGNKSKAINKEITDLADDLLVKKKLTKKQHKAIFAHLQI
jgi:hypothetical protein